MLIDERRSVWEAQCLIVPSLSWDAPTMPYGREDAEWNRLIDAGLRFLVERARMRKVTSYTEMNATLVHRTGSEPFDFEQDGERHAMGALLEAIGERTRPETGVMLTSLVHYLNENDAGPGFYAYAQRIGLLQKGATADDKLAFWAGRVEAAHARYA